MKICPQEITAILVLCLVGCAGVPAEVPRPEHVRALKDSESATVVLGDETYPRHVRSLQEMSAVHLGFSATLPAALSGPQASPYSGTLQPAVRFMGAMAPAIPAVMPAGVR